ncbi:MAG: hypothetical protein HYX65_09025 [Gemmatimonadetes bacterium]|nr:hypothetical protein [Gemmatimonadota bacterium]
MPRRVPVRAPTLRACLAAAALLAAGAVRAAAQVTLVDEGSFTVTRNGVRIGREEFSIRSAPGPNATTIFVAQASAVYDDRRLFPALSARPSGSPVSYQVEVRRGAEVEERWGGSFGAGRVSARITTPRHDAVREFLVADGAVLLDDDIFHQYFFVARRRGPRVLPVIAARRNRQELLRIVDRGSQTVDIGGQPLAATTFLATGADGVERQVWVDADGLVLKVVVAAQGLVALRDDPPKRAENPR